MKTLKYNSQLLSGQQEHYWNEGHLCHAGFVVKYKRDVLLDEYPEVIVFAKRELN